MKNRNKKRALLYIFMFLCTGAVVVLSDFIVLAETDAGGNEREVEKQEEMTGEAIRQSILGQFDFEGIDESLSELFPEEKLDFSDTITALTQGDLAPSAELLKRLILDQINYEFRYNKSVLVHILIIAVFAAVFSNFSGAFQNRQVSEISFYVLYLLLLTVCLNSFRISMEGVEGKIQSLLEFMKVLSPTYFLAVAAASGTSASLAFYNMVLLLIYLVELVIQSVLLPLIHVFIMIKLLDCLSKEEYLSQFTDLIGKIVRWSLKGLLGLVIGLNIVQGILSPAIDSLQRNILTKSAQSLPGIGNAIGGMTDVVLGTAVVIKNGIGVAGAVVCISICAVPLLQAGMMAVLYKLAAALIQPVSDKRIVECISGISEGAELLFQVIFTTGMLFLITVAIITASTG